MVKIHELNINGNEAGVYMDVNDAPEGICIEYEILDEVIEALVGEAAKWGVAVKASDGCLDSRAKRPQVAKEVTIISGRQVEVDGKPFPWLVSGARVEAGKDDALSVTVKMFAERVEADIC